MGVQVRTWPAFWSTRALPTSRWTSILLRRALLSRVAAPGGVNPVDWVADMIAGIIARPSLHGRVYHLVNPRPPENRQIKRTLEAFFDIGGGRFVDHSDFDLAAPNDSETAFRAASGAVRHYLEEDFCFARGSTADAEQAIGRPCPVIDEAALLRLIRHAVSCQFGRHSPRPDVVTAAQWYAAYFERFLPAHIGRSRVAQMTAMDVTVRFAIGDGPTGEWVCQFEHGRLVQVQRGLATPLREEVGYHASDRAFWLGISGTCHPEELFLGGEAEMSGDIERALKLAMILNLFSREFPCNRDTLRQFLLPAEQSADPTTMTHESVRRTA